MQDSFYGHVTTLIVTLGVIRLFLSLQKWLLMECCKWNSYNDCQQINKPLLLGVQEKNDKINIYKESN